MKTRDLKVPEPGGEGPLSEALVWLLHEPSPMVVVVSLLITLAAIAYATKIAYEEGLSYEFQRESMFNAYIIILMMWATFLSMEFISMPSWWMNTVPALVVGLIVFGYAYVRGEKYDEQEKLMLAWFGLPILGLPSIVLPPLYTFTIMTVSAAGFFGVYTGGVGDEPLKHIID